MPQKPFVDRVYERLTGASVRRKQARGQDLFYDIQQSLPRTRIECIFDVGANVGQSAIHYLHRYPGAKLYCFEPVSSAFTELQQKLGSTRAKLFQIGLTSKSGTARMQLSDVSTMHTLTLQESEGTEAVSMQTLDDFCSQNAVDRIGFLKIDTEGHDLEVLKGGRGLLSEGRIDIVEVEAGMNVGNDWHVPFEDLKSFLEDAGYSLFAFYQQRREWPTKQPHLRRTNPVFISQSVIESNTAC